MPYDRDSLENLDAVIDGLDDPSSLEVYEAVLPYEDGMIAASAVRRALEGGGGPGGTPALADVLGEGNDAAGTTITGLPEPENDSEAATKKYVDDNAGGGSQPGAIRLLGPFPFAFDTADLVDGIELFTPEVGDVIVDAKIVITEAWDGENPALADVGTFTGSAGTGGWLAGTAADGVPFDVTGSPSADFGGVLADPGHANSLYTYSIVNASTLAGMHMYLADAPFLESVPVLLVVSQDGSKGGADPESATGAGFVLLKVSTPYLPS